MPKRKSAKRLQMVSAKFLKRGKSSCSRDVVSTIICFLLKSRSHKIRDIFHPECVHCRSPFSRLPRKSREGGSPVILVRGSKKTGANLPKITLKDTSRRHKAWSICYFKGLKRNRQSSPVQSAICHFSPWCHQRFNHSYLTSPLVRAQAIQYGHFVPFTNLLPFWKKLKRSSW